jgi:hypothetical protein
MFIIDGSKAPKQEVISGVEPTLEGETLTLLGDGYSFPYGSTGLCSLGDGRFYVSHDGRTPEGYDTHVKLYRWNGTDPLILETEENSMYEELKKISQEAYDYLTGELRLVTDDAIVVDNYIVTCMHTFHKEVVVAHNGLAFRGCTTVDGNILTNRIVVTNLSRSFLALELQVLRHSTNYGTGENSVVIAHTRTVKQGNTIHQLIVISDNYILIDVAERTNFAICSNDCLRVDVC